MITAEAVTLAQFSSAESAITCVVSQPALPRALVLPKRLVPTAMTPTQAAVAPAVTNTEGAISARPSQQTSADASVAQLFHSFLGSREYRPSAGVTRRWKRHPFFPD